MDVLGRYYTKEIVSAVLVNSLATVSPKRIVDLGIGEASLTKAAYQRWKRAEFYATEIEREKVRSIQSNLSYVNIKKYDSLKINVSAKLKVKLGSIDVAICNPPYLKIKERKKYKKLFAKAGMSGCMKLKQLSSEVVFFAHNITLLRNEGELGIIVSDTLITGKDYKLFRQLILKEFDIKKVIQLPDKIFKKTEARTHILLLNKVKSTSSTCTLVLANEKGAFLKSLEVSKESLIERMDFHFWNYSLKRKVRYTTLKQLGTEIKRGNYSYQVLREGRYPYVHSTSFSDEPRILGNKVRLPQKYRQFASGRGDILMCRVGKRCVGRLAKITKGEILNSNCVYRIRVPQKFRAAVWNSLTSKEGAKWIKAYAHGVCAQVISKSDLENFPVHISTRKRV